METKTPTTVGTGAGVYMCEQAMHKDNTFVSDMQFKLPIIPGTGLIDLTPTNEIKFISGADLLNMHTENIPMLIEDLIPLVAVWAIVGASDTGKSMILRQLAMCIVGNIPFLNFAIFAKYKRVIVVCSEDDEFAISYLLRRQNKTIGLTPEQADNILFVFETDNLPQRLDDLLATSPADAVIIDAFGDVFNGKDLNQNNQVRSFLNQFTQLANKYKCSIGFLHHTGKRTEDLAPSKNNAIGSQGFEAKMRLVMELRNDKNTDDLRHLCIVKGNYFPQERKSSSIVLKMDDNLVFENTGERVKYSDMNEGATGRPIKKEPSTIEDKMHHLCIRTLLLEGKQYSQNDLCRKLEHYWTIGDKVARRFVDYYATNVWIVDVSKRADRRSFKSNLPD
jgi:hypothetical protein